MFIYFLQIQLCCFLSTDIILVKLLGFFFCYLERFQYCASTIILKIRNLTTFEDFKVCLYIFYVDPIRPLRMRDIYLVENVNKLLDPFTVNIPNWTVTNLNAFMSACMKENHENKKKVNLSIGTTCFDLFRRVKVKIFTV